MKTAELEGYLNALLSLALVRDDAHAVNGLQVEASTDVLRVALAVDASLEALTEAARAKADLLLVHHGLFWGGLKPVTGLMAQKLALCFENKISVYSAHLPLDVHPELGNNAQIVKSLGFSADRTFGGYQGREIGLGVACDLPFEELLVRVEASMGGPVRVFGRGASHIHRLAVCSGGAGSQLGYAIDSGHEVFLTGEAAHYVALEAEERGVRLILAGHYRTETFGVKALGAHLAERFGLSVTFVGRDTGL